jgi:hypothetical protein
MHRIDSLRSVAGAFVDKTPSTRGTVVDAAFLNAVQEEICAVIEAFGITLVKGTNDQLLAALTSAPDITYPTISAGWTNVSGNPVGYWVDHFGMLHMVGQATYVSGTSTIFTLPADSRPAVERQFVLPDITGSPAVFVGGFVAWSGEVGASAVTASHAVDFSAISFPVGY